MGEDVGFRVRVRVEVRVRVWVTLTPAISRSVRDATKVLTPRYLSLQ
jgi:hypothetical protein